METNRILGLATLALLFGSLAYAQKPSTAPSRDTSEVLTVTGCVQRETDYRAQIHEGKGGIAGTGIGESHDFVLREVRTASSNTFKPTAAGAPKLETIYRMTGKLESELGNAVGHKVAVSGYVKEKESNGTMKVADLPDMVVVGWHNVADQCTSPVRSTH